MDTFQPTWGLVVTNVQGRGNQGEGKRKGGFVVNLYLLERDEILPARNVPLITLILQLGARG